MCNHGRLRAVGDRLFCKDCGQELPIDFLTGSAGRKQAEKAGPDAKPDKVTSKKRTAKKAE